MLRYGILGIIIAVSLLLSSCENGGAELDCFSAEKHTATIVENETTSILMKTKMHGWCVDRSRSFFLLLAGERMSFSTVMTERSLPCGGTNDSK